MSCPSVRSRPATPLCPATGPSVFRTLSLSGSVWSTVSSPRPCERTYALRPKRSQRADAALLLHERDGRAPCIDEFRQRTGEVLLGQPGGCVELPGGLAQLARPRRHERAVLLAVAVRPFADPGLDDLDAEVRLPARRARELELEDLVRRQACAEVVVLLVGVLPDLGAVPAHEPEDRVLHRGDPGQALLTCGVAVEHGVRDRRRVLAELLEKGVARLGEVLHGAERLGGLGALHHLPQGWEQQPDQEGDDADHDEELDEREGARGAPGRAASRGPEVAEGGLHRVRPDSRKVYGRAGRPDAVGSPGCRPQPGTTPPVWRSPS